MAQLRNFQFLRNSTPSSFASYAAARTAAIAAFGNINTLLDGELVLYSYKLDGDATTVHTLLGIKRTNGIEILGNYDELTAEYQSYVASEIANLDSEKTGSNNGVSVTVKQVDGKIESVTVVADSVTSAIEALDVNPFSLTEVTGTELKGYQISEENGKIVKGQTATTLLTFASEPTATNKVVTLAEIQALDTPEGGVSSADTNNVKVTVTQVDGKVDTVTVVDNSVNATYVEEAIEEAIAGLESEVENETGDIKVKVKQVNGELTAVTVTDTLKAVAHSGAAADVTVAAGIEGLDATNVQAALAELAGDIAELDAAQLEAGTGIEIDAQNNINAKFDIAIETRTGENAGEYIVIKDGENVITEVNANAFVKDGFLQSVTKDATTNELIFTWNTDAEAGEENQVTKIAISDLCDVYTADETYLHLEGYKFEHKTITGLDSENTHGLTADVAVTNTTSTSFNVPSLKVDAAGHVTSVDEKTVTITLPASIDTAVQTIKGHDVNDSHIKTTVTPSEDNKTQTIEVTAIFGSVEDNSEGFAEATEVKEYVDGKIDGLTDYNTETTVSAAENSGIIVTPTIDNADPVNEQRTYAISLATVARVDNPTADGTAGTPSTSSFADNTTTFTYVKDVITDTNGRVKGIVTETVTEFFDAGTY